MPARRKKISSCDLGLDLSKGTESQYFRWFLACYLFGKRIRQETAQKTYEVFMHAGLSTPRKILDAGWDKLVQRLDEGHYNRYDESTARNLLDAMRLLQEKYGGKISRVIEESRNRKDLERRIDEFKGIGPKTVEIFMRDMGPVLYPRRKAA